MPKFFSEKIEVTIDKNRRVPVSFVWNKKEYRINEVIASWQDWGFPKGSPKAKNWRLRHHRNYFRIQTTKDEVFEIYFDRKSRKADNPPQADTARREEGEWYLYQKIS